MGLGTSGKAQLWRFDSAESQELCQRLDAASESWRLLVDYQPAPMAGAQNPGFLRWRVTFFALARNVCALERDIFALARNVCVLARNVCALARNFFALLA